MMNYDTMNTSVSRFAYLDAIMYTPVGVVYTVNDEIIRTWLSSKRKKGEVYVTLRSFPCICRLSRACILRETSTKPLTMLTSLALVNPASVGQQVLAVAFLTSVDSLLFPTYIFSLPPSADCVILRTASSSRLVSSALLCQLLSLSSLEPSFPPLLLVSREISSSGPLCGFRAKTDKEIVRVTPTQTETHRVTMIPYFLQCNKHKKHYKTQFSEQYVKYNKI